MSNQPREFIEVLKEMENGSVHYDLTEGLTNVVAAVMETRKPGKVTLSIDIAPTGKGTVAMKTDVKLKEPEHDRPTSTFFVDGGFQLHRDDPRQERMDLRSPDTHDEPARSLPEQEDNSLRVVGRDD